MSSPNRPSAGPPGRPGRAGRLTDQRGRAQARRDGGGTPTVVTGSRRGLTVLGGALLVVLAGALGAAVDVALSGSLGTVFGILFVGGCVLAAARVHSDDLLGIVITPPLVYALIAIGVGFVHPAEGSGGGTKGKAISIGSDLILRAPVLLIGFGAAVVIVILRSRRTRIARRKQERPVNPPSGRRPSTRSDRDW